MTKRFFFIFVAIGLFNCLRQVWNSWNCFIYYPSSSYHDLESFQLVVEHHMWHLRRLDGLAMPRTVCTSDSTSDSLWGSPGTVCGVTWTDYDKLTQARKPLFFIRVYLSNHVDFVGKYLGTGPDPLYILRGMTNYADQQSNQSIYVSFLLLSKSRSNQQSNQSIYISFPLLS